MTPTQNQARNDAHHLLKIAQRILDDAGLIAYAAEVQAVMNGMRQDAETLASQELKRRIG